MLELRTDFSFDSPNSFNNRYRTNNSIDLCDSRTWPLRPWMMRHWKIRLSRPSLPLHVLGKGEVISLVLQTTRHRSTRVKQLRSWRSWRMKLLEKWRNHVVERYNDILELCDQAWRGTAYERSWVSSEVTTKRKAQIFFRLVACIAGVLLANVMSSRSFIQRPHLIRCESGR